MVEDGDQPVRMRGAAAGRAGGRPGVPYVYYAADVWSDATASMGAPGPVVAVMRWVERFALRGARDVLAALAVMAGQDVGHDRRVRVPDVGLRVDVVDRRGDVEGAVGHDDPV